MPGAFAGMSISTDALASDNRSAYCRAAAAALCCVLLDLSSAGNPAEVTLTLRCSRAAASMPARYVPSPPVASRDGVGRLKPVFSPQIQSDISVALAGYLSCEDHARGTTCFPCPPSAGFHASIPTSAVSFCDSTGLSGIPGLSHAVQRWRRPVDGVQPRRRSRRRRAGSRLRAR